MTPYPNGKSRPAAGVWFEYDASTRKRMRLACSALPVIRCSDGVGARGRRACPPDGLTGRCVPACVTYSYIQFG